MLKLDKKAIESKLKKLDAMNFFNPFDLIYIGDMLDSLFSVGIKYNKQTFYINYHDVVFTCFINDIKDIEEEVYYVSMNKTQMQIFENTIILFAQKVYQSNIDFDKFLRNIWLNSDKKDKFICKIIPKICKNYFSDDVVNYLQRLSIRGYSYNKHRICIQIFLPIILVLLA